MQDSILTTVVKDIDGEVTTLEKFAGNVLLIVNVASKCGLTPQYEQLESCPCPSNTAAISPTPAPLETPSSPGSARGFSNNACITAPDIASAAPTSNTASVRGRRICQTNSSPRGVNQSPGEIHCSPAQRLKRSASSIKTDRHNNQRIFCRCCWRASVSMVSVLLKCHGVDFTVTLRQ
jgi:hypothetical protein